MYIILAGRLGVKLVGRDCAPHIGTANAVNCAKRNYGAAGATYT